MQRIKNQIETLFDEFQPDGYRPRDISTPLISPGIVKRMAEILNIDIVTEYYQVPNIKTFLKTFMLQCKLEDGISPDEIQSCLDMVTQERQKHKSGSETEPESSPEVPEISRVSSSQLYCIECGLVGSRFCVVCKDILCIDCCGRLHANGNRSRHHINKIISCSMCDSAPSRLQCTYTFKAFCVDCYSKKHVRTIPTAMLDLKPLRIDYTLSHTTSPAVMRLDTEFAFTLKENQTAYSDGRLLAKGEVDPAVELRTSASFSVPLPTHLSHDWHPFIDSSGVGYFYNFKTEESMRRGSPGKMKIESEERDAADRIEKSVRKIRFDNGPKVLSDKLTKEQKAILDAYNS